MKNPKFVITLISITLLIILGGFYIYHQTNDFLKGPMIRIEDYPGYALTEELFEISGTASNIAFLSLNGNQIFTDEKGHFVEKLLLLHGYNIIQIKATDKFGRERLETVQLVYDTLPHLY